MYRKKSAPIINEIIENDVAFSPKDYIEYKKNVEGHIIPPLAEKCVICFEPSLLNLAKKKFRAKKVQWFRPELDVYKSEEIIFLNINYGAALSALILEELIALGVKNYVVLGSAGTLQRKVPPGSFVVAT